MVRMQLLVWTVVLVIGLAAGGCDSRQGSTPEPATAHKVSVLASIYPMAEMASRVGGNHVDVQWLAESGTRPEEAERGGAALQVRANRAELMITSGPWDAWAVSELSAPTRDTRRVEPGRMPSARSVGAAGAYLWLDPAVVREMVDGTRSRLTVIDPTHSADYQQNARAYLAEVDEVDREFREGLAGAAGRAVLAVSPAWGAMCARYKLEVHAPILDESGKPLMEEQLAGEQFKTLARTAQTLRLKTIMIDAATPAAVRQRIEEKTGLRAITLDALGTSAADGRNTWAKIMRYDLGQLKKGLE